MDSILFGKALQLSKAVGIILLKTEVTPLGAGHVNAPQAEIEPQAIYGDTNCFKVACSTTQEVRTERIEDSRASSTPVPCGYRRALRPFVSPHYSQVWTIAQETGL